MFMPNYIRENSINYRTMARRLSQHNPLIQYLQDGQNLIQELDNLGEVDENLSRSRRRLFKRPDVPDLSNGFLTRFLRQRNEPITSTPAPNHHRLLSSFDISPVGFDSDVDNEAIPNLPDVNAVTTNLTLVERKKNLDAIVNKLLTATPPSKTKQTFDPVLQCFGGKSPISSISSESNDFHAPSCSGSDSNPKRLKSTNAKEPVVRLTRLPNLQMSESDSTDDCNEIVDLPPQESSNHLSNKEIKTKSNRDIQEASQRAGASSPKKNVPKKKTTNNKRKKNVFQEIYDTNRVETETNYQNATQDETSGLRRSNRVRKQRSDIYMGGVVLVTSERYYNQLMKTNDSSSKRSVGGKSLMKLDGRKKINKNKKKSKLPQIVEDEVEPIETPEVPDMQPNVNIISEVVMEPEPGCSYQLDEPEIVTPRKKNGFTKSMEKTPVKNTSSCSLERIVNGKSRVIQFTRKNNRYEGLCEGIRLLVNGVDPNDDILTGVIVIDPKSEKALSTPVRHTFAFTVLEGRAEVTLQDQIHVLDKFNGLLVPVGYEYSIKNLSNSKNLEMSFTRILIKK